MQKPFCSNRKRSDKIDKDGNKSAATIFYNIKFIDSVRLIANSLSNLVDNQILLKMRKEFEKLNAKIVIVFLNMKVSRTI